ncbi:DUF350 domain-containing protein [Neisseria sp. Ec49-e6-T10]|uniref:DUF350 domain-containing protein n=1 Tax=Neisseria sp. Ec49-e6-T10 TaxID=3140744 RepID=UPI003EBA60B0
MSITLVQFLAYLKYMGAGGLTVAAFIFIYLHLTPIKEIRLIREGCVSCALSLAGAVLGFCLTVASSILHADGILNFMVWSLCAAVVQLLVYFALIKLIPHALSSLEDNNIAVGGLFCTISLAIGILNAACLS